MTYHHPYTTRFTSPETRLEEAGLDAIAVMSIAHDIETDFGIEIEDRVVEGWSVVGDIERFVEGLRREAA